MKKFLFVLLMGLCSIEVFVQAGIIGATRWVKGDKIVCVYHDYHDLGTRGENQAHFECIQRKLSHQVGRPLTVLVENTCCGDLAGFVREIDRRALGGRFLELFDDVIGTKNSCDVTFKSIDARSKVFLIDTWVGAWCHEQEQLDKPFLMRLMQALRPYTFNGICREALGNMQRCFERAKGSTVEGFVEQQRELLLKNLCRFKDNFCAKTKIAPQDFVQRPLIDYFLNPQDRRRLPALQCIGGGDGFFAQELLAPLVDATLVCEVLLTPDDVTVFAGVLHSEMLSDLLELLGYVKDRSMHEAVERLANAEGDIASELNVVPLDVYDWIR